MIKSPLNYMGGKAKLLEQILPLFPTKINNFVDLFCGGCNVGININAKHIYFNDNNKELIALYKYFYENNVDEIIKDIFTIIEKYQLSLVSQHGYGFYDCNSTDGLSLYNKENYNRLRRHYNEKSRKMKIYAELYVLIVYAFNNQIRFNSKGEFNLPVGKRDFNKKMEEKLYMFVEKLKKQKCTFSCKDFREFDIEILNDNDLVYVDPPYLITCATYNEQKGWTEKDEYELLKFLDNMNNNNIKFALSNVMKNKGKENIILKDWLKKNKKYNIIHLNNNYKNCNYQTKNKNKVCDEVLIINY